MNRNALFIITGDPRTSPRPAEAVRIAAGVGAWKKIDVTVYLRGQTVLSLNEFTDELVDADNYARYWPIIGGWGRPIQVQQGNPWLAGVENPGLTWREISDAELAALAAGSDYVLRF